MDFGEFLGGIGTVDLLIVLYFIGFFVLGFAQGTIRRLLGILSILFSFLLAASLADRCREFLGDNWRQFSPEYGYMVGFLVVFVASSVAFALVIQGFYKPQPLFQKARFADEIIGGILGIVQAALIFGALLIILDSFFRIPGIPPDPDELPFLRDIWTAIDPTKTAELFRETSDPGLLPADRAVHPEPHRSDVPVDLSVIDRALLAGPHDRRGPRPDRRLAWSATTPPAAASAGSSKSRPTSARTTEPRMPVRRDGTQSRSCSDRPAGPTCTLSTGCTTASTW